MTSDPKPLVLSNHNITLALRRADAPEALVTSPVNLSPVALDGFESIADILPRVLRRLEVLHLAAEIERIERELQKAPKPASVAS